MAGGEEGRVERSGGLYFSEVLAAAREGRGAGVGGVTEVVGAPLTSWLSCFSEGMLARISEVPWTKAIGEGSDRVLLLIRMILCSIEVAYCMDNCCLCCAWWANVV